MNISNIDSKERCRYFRKRILEVSQNVQALHIGSAYSCTEIVDAIYFELMEKNEDSSFKDVFDVQGTWVHDPICYTRRTWHFIRE